MKKLDPECSEFSRLIDERALYVDKSLLICDALTYFHHCTKAYIRPKGFGKTTNLSMLEEYLDVRRKGTQRFDGLEISKPEHSKFWVHKNSHNVIRLNMKDCVGNGWEEFIHKFGHMMSKAYIEHLDDVPIIPERRERFNRIISETATEDELLFALYLLTRTLRKHNRLRTTVLIDDYDMPVIANMGNESAKKILEYITHVFSKALEDNEYITNAVITATTHAEFETMFFGPLLIEKTDVIWCSEDSHGFTEAETKMILEETGHTDRLDEVREWYGGYRLNDHEMYNPYSVMRYVANGCCEPEPYWGDSTKDLLDYTLDMAARYHPTLIARLLNSDVEDKWTFRGLGTESLVRNYRDWTVLTSTGYLTAENVGEIRYRFSIPNREVRTVLRRAVIQSAFENPDACSVFHEMLMNDGDAAIISALEKVIHRQDPFQGDCPPGLLMAAVLECLSDIYTIRVDAGRIGYMFTAVSDDPSRPDVMMKWEYTCFDGYLEERAEDQLRMIHDSALQLNTEKDTVLAGIGFSKRDSCVKTMIVEGGRMA